MAVLDPTTQAAWLAAATDDAKALTIVGALTEPVEVEIRNAADTLMGSGTMTSPWATAVGGTVVLGEVDTDLIEALEEGAPDGSWRCLFKGANGRYVQAGFGLPGSGREVIWSLATWQVGDKASIGTATVGAIIATNGTFSLVAADLDATTAAAFTAATSTAGQAAAIMAAMTGTVVFEIFDGSNVLRASGTMQAPWASAAGGVLTVNEVTSAGVVVASGGIPDGSWYAQYRAGTRYVRGSFGIGNSSADFVWSLSVFQTGTKATLGSVLMTCAGPITVTNNPPLWTTVPTLTVTQGSSSAPLLSNYANDPDAGQTLSFAIQSGSLPSGLTLNPSTGTFSATAGVPVGTYGPYVVSADDGQTASTSPSNTVLPIISGAAQVGSTLTCSTGTWAGTTPITYNYQWLRNGSPISGALSSVYTLVLADLAAMITCRVTAINVTNTPVEATSASVGPVASAPSGGTLSVPFTLTSVVGGANRPWAFGHAFKQGDVPSGASIASTIGEFQSTATTYWPDGSVKHAIIAGRTTLTANVATPITLAIGAGTGGSNLTESELSSWLPTTTITVGSHTTTLNSLIGTLALYRTVCSGPVMSNWIYRQAVTGSNHLVIWADVRLYKGGQVEILPWIENAYFLVASPTAVTQACSVSIGGSVVFPSTAITFYHHTRVLLVNGRTDGYWTGTDPQITPKHDLAYLRATKLVPNYGWTSPSAARLNALTQSYTPNTYAGVPLMTSSGGDSSAILGFTGSAPDVMYVATGDIRAYKGALTMSFAGGTWDVHYRDETTNEPFRFDTYPTASLQIQQTPVVPTGTGGDSNWGATGSRTSHQMSRGFLAWIISGRWWHLDEALFWSGINYLVQTTASRLNAGGVIRSTAGANTDRGAAWGLRQLAQALAITPTTHPCYPGLVASWEANTQWYSDQVTGAGEWVNNLGVLPYYGTKFQFVYGYHPGYADIAGWMQMMLVQVWGYSWDLGLPQSTASRTRHQAVRDHAYKLPVGMSGDGTAGNWDYRWFGPYELVISPVGGPWLANFGEVLDKHINTLATGVVNVPTDNRLYRPGSTSLWPANDATYMTSYFGQHTTALAYAVDHGAPGAAAAWARVTSANDGGGHGAWSTVALQFNDYPQYGIVPRA